MLFHPTTTVNILRGTATNALGDEVDGSGVVASGIPASVTESRRTVMTPGMDAPRVIRSYACRLPATADVTVGDRVKDNGTGVIYTIDSSTRGATLAGGRADLRVDLRRVT
jgi:hypothetical protein